MNEVKSHKNTGLPDSAPSWSVSDEAAYLAPWIDERRLPRLTGDLVTVGGQIKTYPEDFVVEEIPAYIPSGSGEFLYLWVEKRDLSGEGLLRALAHGLALPEGEIGIAGVKDRRALTRQWVSVPRRAEPNLRLVENDKRVRILNVSAHTNKLRTGHLLGNRFSVLIRNTHSAVPEQHADRIVERLKSGFLNFYGSQRFGVGGETALAGLELVRKEQTARTKRMVSTRFRKRFAISAAQSVLFNHYLVERVENGLSRTVLVGDYMAKRSSGGLFVALDAAVEQQRFDDGETTPTGPIFGSKMRSPANLALKYETDVLSYHRLSAAHFAAFGKIALGTRRPLWVFPGYLTSVADNSVVPTAVRVEFSLPSGSYATILLREFLDFPANVAEDDDASPIDDS